MIGAHVPPLPTGLPNYVQRAATYIARRAAKELDIVPGRSPISVAAAAIYMASQVLCFFSNPVLSEFCQSCFLLAFAVNRNAKIFISVSSVAKFIYSYGEGCRKKVTS